jgi:hypothetical protein
VEDMGDFEEEAQQPEEPEDEAVPAGELAEEEV